MSANIMVEIVKQTSREVDDYFHAHCLNCGWRSSGFIREDAARRRATAHGSTPRHGAATVEIRRP